MRTRRPDVGEEKLVLPVKRGEGVGCKACGTRPQAGQVSAPLRRGDYKPRRSQSASGGLGRGAQSALLRYNYRSRTGTICLPSEKNSTLFFEKSKHTPLIRIAKLVGEDIREVKLEQATG